MNKFGKQIRIMKVAAFG